MLMSGTLNPCGMYRMVELLQTSDTSTERDREVAESLSALLNGGGSKKKTPSVCPPPGALIHRHPRSFAAGSATQYRDQESE